MGADHGTQPDGNGRTLRSHGLGADILAQRSIIPSGEDAAHRIDAGIREDLWAGNRRLPRGQVRSLMIRFALCSEIGLWRDS